MKPNWDTSIPKSLEDKINFLLQERDKVNKNHEDFQQQDIVPRFKKALHRQNQSIGEKVESMLTSEKSVLIEIFDQELARGQSPGIMKGKQRKISPEHVKTKRIAKFVVNNSDDFISENNYKTNKTCRSVSTAATPNDLTQSPRSHFSYNQGKENFDHNRQNSIDQQKYIEQQKHEIGELKEQLKFKCRCNSLEKFKNSIGEKLIHQKTIYEELLAEKENQHAEETLSLKKQLQVIVKEKQKFELDVKVFKETLCTKLQEYAQKLDDFNKRETQIQQIERENIRLKLENEEMALLLQRLLKQRQ